MQNSEFEKVYNPSLVEEKWYPIWEDAGALKINTTAEKVNPTEDDA